MVEEALGNTGNQQGARTQASAMTSGDAQPGSGACTPHSAGPTPAQRAVVIASILDERASRAVRGGAGQDHCAVAVGGARKQHRNEAALFPKPNIPNATTRTRMKWPHAPHQKENDKRGQTRKAPEIDRRQQQREKDKKR